MGANMYNPKVGDTIRVTFEDVVTGIDIDGGVELANAHYADEPFVFELDEPTLVGVELVKPPVEYFKPGDRLQRRNLSYQVTLAEVGYLQHHSTGSVHYYDEPSHGEGSEFHSGNYELVVR